MFYINVMIIHGASMLMGQVTDLNQDAIFSILEARLLQLKGGNHLNNGKKQARWVVHEFFSVTTHLISIQNKLCKVELLSKIPNGCSTLIMFVENKSKRGDSYVSPISGKCCKISSFGIIFPVSTFYLR